MGSLVIRSRSIGAWQENSYIIEYEGESILVDPGDDFESLDLFFSESGSKHKAIINTHGHFDHVGAIEDFKLKYRLNFYLHSKDKQLIHQANLYRKFAGGSYITRTPKVDVLLDDIEFVPIADKKIKIHHTPGHSEGSVCFEIDSSLISGDLLFENSLGRTDLPGGNREQLVRSVDFILSNFAGYKIYPGHGAPFYLDEKTISGIRKLL